MTLSSLYIIKSSVLLAAFLLYYAFVLKKQTFFTLNRVYLLGTLILSICIPFFHFTLAVDIMETDGSLPPLYYVSGLIEEISVSGREVSDYEWLYCLSWIYLGGVCFFLLRYARGLFQIRQLIHSHECKRVRNLKIVMLSSNYPVFSFFNYIFINTSLDYKIEANSVLRHEIIHVRYMHGFDLLLSEIICIFYWFHPLVWIYKKNIAQNHEYIADKEVAVKYQTGRYFQLLVNQALKGKMFSFTNCFSCSNLKKRMIMMTKKQSNKFNVLNYIPALFIGGILCVVLTCIVTQAPALSFISEEAPVTTTIVGSIAVDSSEVFAVVEKMPQFDGDMQAWLAANLKYPQKALAAQEEGKVLVSFIIEKDGSVSNVKVSQPASSSLDTEAVRVVKAMPKWIPGKQRGETVRVAFTLPIHFQLPLEYQVFRVVEIMPEFNGNMNTWLKDNLKYPKKAQETKEQGKVYVNFVVNEDGSLSDFRIERSSGSQALDEEALRVTKAMPNWLPGKQRGRTVKTAFTLPVNFVLPQ